MRLLVLGANGMLGRTVSTYFVENGHDVVGFARRPVTHCTRGYTGDAQNTQLLSDLIFSDDFDAVINCIGLLNREAEENPSSAVYLNSFLPHYLAEITKRLRTRIIQMSTDCVFSGKRGGYAEYDFKDGETFYDRTKALGELDDDKNTTLRCSIVGPDCDPSGIGLLNWFMQQRNSVKGYTKAIWTGQTTLQVAKTMEMVIRQGFAGLVNAVPNDSISKYDLLVMFNQYLRKDQLEIIPFDGFVSDKSLKRTNNALNYEIPDYETMIHDLQEWMNGHKALYPHYNLRD